MSPLIIGEIAGAVFPALLVLAAIGLRFYYCNEINKEKEREGIVEKDVIAALAPPFLLAQFTSIAAGYALLQLQMLFFLVSLQLSGNSSRCRDRSYYTAYRNSYRGNCCS